MNKLIIPFLFIACFFMTSCHKDDEPKDKVSDDLVTKPELPADKEIASLDDIEYQALCPFDKYVIESLYYISLIRYD